MTIEESIKKAVKKNKQILLNKNKVSIDNSKIKNPCLLYSLDNKSIISVYFWEFIKENNYLYGFKVNNSEVTDYYKIKNFLVSTNDINDPMVNERPQFHCIEYDPTTNEVLSEYMHRGIQETKHVNGKIVQKNYICQYHDLPDDYKNKINNIPKNLINGYSCKNGHKTILLKGLDYNCT